MAGFSDRAALDDILVCVGFFTRFPVRAPRQERPFGTAIWAAPVAGLLVGLIVWLAMLAALWLGLTASFAAVVALGAGILGTGALHEDGAADVADGFGGGRTREAKLSIMRDSRIGTYGIIALVLSLLARWSALATIATLGPWRILFVVVAAHAASRALLPALAAALPPARSDGLSSGLGAVDREVAAVALVIGLAALLPLGVKPAVVAVAVLAALFIWLHRLSRRQIGGQTGDVLGALQQAAETAILIISATAAP
jgi:adenosylcobinamide-GDP ribazoletransferase